MHKKNLSVKCQKFLWILLQDTKARLEATYKICVEVILASASKKKNKVCFLEKKLKIFFWMLCAYKFIQINDKPSFVCLELNLNELVKMLSENFSRASPI